MKSVINAACVDDEIDNIIMKIVRGFGVIIYLSLRGKQILYITNIMSSSTSSPLQHAQNFSFILLIVIVSVAFVLFVIGCSVVSHISSYDKMYKIGDQVFRSEFMKAMDELRSKMPGNERFLGDKQKAQYLELVAVHQKMKDDETKYHRTKV